MRIKAVLNNTDDPHNDLPDLSRSEKIYRIQLARMSGIGPVTFQKLIEEYGTAEQAIKCHNFKDKKIIDINAVESSLKQTQQFGAHTLIWGDKTYPRYLYELPDAPPILYAKGDITLLQAPTIGAVGARNASAVGIKLTKTLAGELGKKEYTIASGLARGIDTAAHQASLKTGTIACVAGGLDIPYPPENETLYEKITQEGVAITEMPLGTKPQARHFPRRNRLISGLSQGVIVIEAAKKSGSLITARLAGEYGREVFAVPGSPLDPRSYGTNQLIKDGAVLTRDINDILEALPDKHAGNRTSSEPPEKQKTKKPDTVETDVDKNTASQPTEPASIDAGKQEDLILSLLSLNPVHIDEIIRQSGIKTGDAATILTTLEITGRIIKHSGGRISLSPL